MAVFALLALLVGSSYAAYCNGKPNPNAQMNTNSILQNQPVYIKSAPNAHLYQLNNGTDMIPIVHVYGTPFQMGYGQGLVRPDARNFIEDVYAYFDEQAYIAVNETGHYPEWMPEWFFDDLVNLGMDAALQLELDATRDFTPEYFFEELRGLSAATGVSQQKLEWVHLIGELTKGSCSMFGAWGKAVPSIYSMLQLRGLDWDMDGPFRDYPQVTVYHPSEGHPFANVGYCGFIGSFSGMSSVCTGTSQIGVSYPDDTFGKESRHGIPFTYLLRDLLQFDKSLNDSIDRITNANRTCDLILGVGDGNMGQFRGIEYSYSTALFFDDTNMQPTADWHPLIPNTVYYGMDWNCPNYDTVFAQQLNALYGNITPEIGILNITSILQSGDNFCTYYDLTPSRQQMYIAFASPHGSTGPAAAFDRTFSKVNMMDMWKVPPPTAEQIEATKDVVWSPSRL
jgi:hypothetical protein